MSHDSRSPKKGIYLLPNLFTTAGLFSGFYSIVASMQHKFEIACIAIFIAMIADSLDGRVARLTNTQSAFGAEYDSLTDLVAFGLAPALLMFNWSIHSLGKIGWLAAFFYVACAALRLARFNTQLDSADKDYFFGLATTAAAGFMAGFVWVMHDYGINNGVHLNSLVAFYTVFTGALMVSNIRYYSFKVFDFKGKVPFIGLVAVLLIVMAITIEPPVVLYFAFAVYVILAPLFSIFVKEKSKEEIELDSDQEF